jgi:hypothetical protein
MSLNSASGTSSLMNNTEDNDIIELQNRLQFTKNIQVRITYPFFYRNTFLGNLVCYTYWSKSSYYFLGCTFITK